MEKRLARGGDRGGGGEKVEWRWWEGMSSEVLALIFGRMTADELSRTVPFVCRGWWEVLAGPYCWAEIDVEQWCRRVNRSDVIESAVRRLVRRSRGNLRRLSAYRIGNSAFSYVANSYNFRTSDLPFLCCFSLLSFFFYYFVLPQFCFSGLVCSTNKQYSVVVNWFLECVSFLTFFWLYLDFVFLIYFFMSCYLFFLIYLSIYV